MLLEIDYLNIAVNLLMFIVPSLIVFGVSYSLISKFLDDQRNARMLDIKKEYSSQVTPVKLQAYERLTIFLDRISPDNLVMRHSRGGQTAAELRALLIHNVSEEFNHNVSQQIFVSNQAWTLIKAVKEQIIAIIDASFKRCDESTSGPELGKMILQHLMDQKEVPTQRAIEFLKREIEIIL